VISPLASWLLTVAVAVVLGVGLYLLAWHRGYTAGLAARIEYLPVNPPWVPPSEGEFMGELLDDLRRNEPPRKYRREP
jgi:hypothetical protein